MTSKIDRLTIQTYKKTKILFQSIWNTWVGKLKREGKTRSATTQDRFMERMLLLIEAVDIKGYSLLRDDVLAFLVARTNDYFGCFAEIPKEETELWEMIKSMEEIKNVIKENT